MLRLMTATFDEVNIDPVNIKYIEGHVTGTQAGDPVECEAITKVFCPDYRPDPLLIGCMKSNMGHSEGSSGVCSVSKSALIFQRKMIPPNINYVTPNPNIEGLVNGKLKPVLEPTPFNEDVIALNSFGFGGANVHTIIRSNPVKEKPADQIVTGGLTGNLQRLILYKARTQEGFHSLISTIQKNPEKITKGFLEIISNISRLNDKFQLPYRSFILLDANKNITTADCKLIIEKAPKEIFLEIGLNENTSFPADLMEMSVFKKSINDSLELIGKDVNCFLDTKNEDTGERILKSIIYNSALIELIKSFDLSVKIIETPHSDTGVSQLLASFAMGKISQSSLVSFFDEIQSLLKYDLRLSSAVDAKVASHANGNVCKSGCTSTKLDDANNNMPLGAKNLKALFDSNHNLDILAMFENWNHEKQMNANIQDANIQDANIQDANSHGAKMLMNRNDESMMNATIELSKINAKDGIVIQTCNKIGASLNPGVQVMSINSNTKCNEILSLLGSLYVEGNEISIKSLYPSVTYPVPVETASVSPLIKWDHSVDRQIYRVPDYMNWRLKNKPFDINLSELFTYAGGHVIDDRILFPAAGYLWLIWQSLAIEEILQNLDAYKEKGVEFHDEKLHRATIVPKTGSVRVTTCINNNTGWFEISDTNEAIICSGFAKLTNDPAPQVPDSGIEDDPADMICGKDFYKELRVRGYEYKNSFQGVTESRIDGSGGYVNFLEHWVCFCDAVFQLSLLASPTRELILPTGFDYLKCDIKTLLKFKEEKEREITLRDEKTAEDKRVADEQKRIEESEKREGIEYLERNEAEAVAEGARTKSLAERIKEQEEMIKERVKFKVNVNKTTQEVSTIGLYVKGMKASPAPRKKQNPMHRSISFTPFDQDLEEEVHTLEMKEKYMNECRDVLFHVDTSKSGVSIGTSESGVSIGTSESGVSKVESSTAQTPNGKVPNGHIPNGNVPNGNLPITQVLTSVDGDEEETDSSKGLLNKLIELKKKNLPLQDTIECLKESAKYMACDLLLKLPSDQMALEHLMYVVSDNFYEKELQILEINLSQKSSVVEEIKGTLNNLRMKCKYTLAEEEKPGDHEKIDQTMTIGQLMKNKMTNANLTIIQHPSMAFSFLQEDSTKGIENSDTFERMIKSTYNQMESNSFLLSVFRSDVSQLEKDLFKPVERIPKDEISTLLISTGFIPIASKSVGDFSLILVRKPTIQTDSVKVIETETFNHEWVDTLKNVMFDKENKTDKIWVKGQDFDTNGLIGFMHCLKKEDPRVRGVLLMNQPPMSGPSTYRTQSIVSKEQVMDHVMKSDLLLSVYKDNQLGTYLSRPVTNDMIVQSSDQGFLDVESKGDLSSLKYYTWSEENLLNPNSDTYCQIHYSALNFKDVMVASGRVPLVAYPESFRNQENGNLGMEFSGKLAKNGAKIMGFVATNAIATGIDIKNSGSFMWEVPEKMSLEEAATIPVVYSTVYYALIMRGKLRPRESILIHAGSGGVGQAAINVCQSMACEIYTTVGSQEKRDFIKNTFAIPDDHIFNSRSVSFADDLLRATNGRGVDVVLNSLADDKLLAGISCLADSGRFVEIGKYDLISDHLLGELRELGMLKNSNICAEI